MARVAYSPSALADLERLFAVLAERDPESAISASDAIQGAVDMLEHHPMIGRMVRGDVRELVISFGRTGYVALYRFVPARDVVRILAIRHQRELDYPA